MCIDTCLFVCLFQAFSEIEMRENELGLIRDGSKTAIKKPKATKRTQREAMKGYMKMFYNKERIQVGFISSQIIPFCS